MERDSLRPVGLKRLSMRSMKKEAVVSLHGEKNTNNQNNPHSAQQHVHNSHEKEVSASKEKEDAVLKAVMKKLVSTGKRVSFKTKEKL